MINIGKILKRSWHILWNYKILWIFGFLLAITAGGSGNSGRAGAAVPATSSAVMLEAMEQQLPTFNPVHSCAS